MFAFWWLKIASEKHCNFYDTFVHFQQKRVACNWLRWERNKSERIIMLYEHLFEIYFRDLYFRHFLCVSRFSNFEILISENLSRNRQYLFLINNHMVYIYISLSNNMILDFKHGVFLVLLKHCTAFCGQLQWVDQFPHHFSRCQFIAFAKYVQVNSKHYKQSGPNVSANQQGDF